ncbi:Choline dehydrogenase, mitochondrial [Leucoagaricus sp. SymC.cos]|nr:Choline dehydrogenase, mitochondrial [Leucoagaricus sp. SymC.cos]
MHSTAGRVPVTLPGFSHPLVDSLALRASEELGGDFKYNVDMNSSTPLGLGWLQLTIGYDGTRSSAAETYLDDETMSRDNLHAVTDTRVTRVLKINGTEGLTIRMVEVRNSELVEPVLLTASKEVVLSAGSIGTPLILIHSVIADADSLAELGVTPMLNNTSVGKNLTDHLAFGVMFGLAPGSLDLGPWANLDTDPALQAKVLNIRNTNRTGPYVQPTPTDHLAWIRLSSNITDTLGDPSSSPNSAHVEFIVSATPDAYVVVVVLVSPASRKYTSMIFFGGGSDFDHRSFCQEGCYAKNLDLLTAHEGFKSAINWTRAPVFDNIITGLVGPFANASTEAEINNIIRNIT